MELLDKISINNRSYSLLANGVRQVTFLKFNAYVIAIYIEDKQMEEKPKDIETGQPNQTEPSNNEAQPEAKPTGPSPPPNAPTSTTTQTSSTSP